MILANPALTLAIVISYCIAMGQLTLVAIKGYFAADFAMYWRVANEPLMMAYLPSNDWPFPYLPTMLLWLRPLTMATLWTAYIIFVIASSAVLWVACRRYISAKATILVLFSPPLINAFCTGQVSAALTAALLWAFGTTHRLAAGAVFGLVATIKPQFVIMVPLFLLMVRDWRALIASAVIFLVIVTASIKAYGLDTWFIWFASLTDFQEMLVSQEVLSFAVTPASAAQHWGWPPLPFLILGAAAGAWLVLKCRNQHPLSVTAAVGGGSLLAAPYGLLQDLAVVIPFLTWAVFQGRITAALAMSGALNPFPLLLTAFNLTGQQVAPVEACATTGSSNPMCA